jgi:hypothetical protein
MFVIQQCLEQILISVDGHKHDIYTKVGVVRDTSFVAVVVVAAVVKLQGQSRHFYIYSFFCHKKVLLGIVPNEVLFTPAISQSQYPILTSFASEIIINTINEVICLTFISIITMQ